MASGRVNNAMASGSRTILIVEDDAGSRRALEELVVSYGYGTRSAANGQEALAVAAEREFEGVLLDLRLPDMNGLLVLKQLRVLHPTVPILIISGYEDFKAQALASGAQGFVLKPFDAKRLRDLMLDWFGTP
jgi:DNA-binding NtrC family response regulator